MSLNKITLLDRQPFKFMTATVGNLPTSFVDSMSYYEMLAWLCQYVTNTLIPQINGNTEAINAIQDEFIALQKEVERQIAEIPQLRADFEALVVRFDETIAQLQKQYVEFEHEVDETIAREIANVRSSLMLIIDGNFAELNEKIDDEVARLDEKIETYPVSHLIVFNSLRGIYTILQTYLDDLADVGRVEGITAGEYDALELEAKEYDDKELTAKEYDYYGKTILTA